MCPGSLDQGLLRQKSRWGLYLKLILLVTLEIQLSGVKKVLFYFDKRPLEVLQRHLKALGDPPRCPLVSGLWCLSYMNETNLPALFLSDQFVGPSGASRARGTI